MGGVGSEGLAGGGRRVGRDAVVVAAHEASTSRQVGIFLLHASEELCLGHEVQLRERLRPRGA